MNIRTLISGLVMLLSFTAAMSQDADGCKDHPMFPTRMSNYFISECTHNFDAVEFNIAAGGETKTTKEGTKSVLKYDFNIDTGKPKPSALQILRNYENAAKKINGTTVFLSNGEGLAVFKIMKGSKEIAWVKVECGGNDNSDFYNLYIIELAEMNQEISSTDMMTALETDGHIALYINFETGKSEIQPESNKIIDQIAEMLQANPSLKISVEGHTDNTGNAASNRTLSQSRSAAVVSSLVAKGTDKARLSSKGWGQDKPVSDNATEEGRAKNRRVEIVKL